MAAEAPDSVTARTPKMHEERVRKEWARQQRFDDHANDLIIARVHADAHVNAAQAWANALVTIAEKLCAMVRDSDARKSS